MTNKICYRITVDFHSCLENVLKLDPFKSDLITHPKMNTEYLGVGYNEHDIPKHMFLVTLEK